MGLILIVTVAGVIMVARGLWTSGFYVGTHTSAAGPRSESANLALRDFMFEAIGVHTANQADRRLI